MPLPANKQRSRRQRKKMHIGEFQELGFEYEVTPAAELAPQEQEVLMEKFLEEIILPRGLMLGGWLNDGFVSAFPRGSATEEDRQAVEAWLKAHVNGAQVKLSALKDAWYVED
ncbi:YggL family protein [Diaphorobacter ruginosibacter]|uniref:YggL family protein n=1 Tax=Diaphorobacter ruginosibacter TaxID=1715720 RepID=A0A7G9RUQ8_9BURK|nr:YggL family protein [Diaphorobacter ruginosibacter]QNN59333.1 YggL family protein [Diaphorobacter ruginosibacter]